MADDNYLGIKRRARSRGKPRTHEVIQFKVTCIGPDKQTEITYFIGARSEHLAWSEAIGQFGSSYPEVDIAKIQVDISPA